MHLISRHNSTSCYASRMGVYSFLCFILCTQLPDDASNRSAWHPDSSSHSVGWSSSLQPCPPARLADSRCWRTRLGRRCAAETYCHEPVCASSTRVVSMIEQHHSFLCFFVLVPLLAWCLGVEYDPGPNLRCMQCGYSLLNDARRRWPPRLLD